MIERFECMPGLSSVPSTSTASKKSHQQPETFKLIPTVDKTLKKKEEKVSALPDTNDGIRSTITTILLSENARVKDRR